MALVRRDLRDPHRSPARPLRCPVSHSVAPNQAGVLATAEALHRFETDGSPITAADTKLTSMGRVLKEYRTPCGVAAVGRHLYQSSRGGKTSCPLDRNARIVVGSIPRSARIISRTYAESGSGPAGRTRRTSPRRGGLAGLNRLAPSDFPGIGGVRGAHGVLPACAPSPEPGSGVGRVRFPGITDPTGPRLANRSTPGGSELRAPIGPAPCPSRPRGASASGPGVRPGWRRAAP